MQKAESPKPDSSLSLTAACYLLWMWLSSGRVCCCKSHRIIHLLIYMPWPESNVPFCFFALSRKLHIEVTFSLNPCLIFTNIYAFSLKTSRSRTSSPAKEKSAKNPYSESVIVELKRLVLRFLALSIHHTLSIFWKLIGDFLTHVYTFLTLCNNILNNNQALVPCKLQQFWINNGNFLMCHVILRSLLCYDMVMCSPTVCLI